MHTRQKLMRLPKMLWFPGEFPPPLQPCVWSSGGYARAVWGGGRWHRDGGGRDWRSSSYHETFSLALTYTYAQHTLQTWLVCFHLWHTWLAPMGSCEGQDGGDAEPEAFNWEATVFIKYQRECWWVASDCSIRNSLNNSTAVQRKQAK